MISDDEVGSILRSADGLDAAAEALVRAANQSGGRDNITVVCSGWARPTGRRPRPADDETSRGSNRRRLARRG